MAVGSRAEGVFLSQVTRLLLIKVVPHLVARRRTLPTYFTNMPWGCSQVLYQVLYQRKGGVGAEPIVSGISWTALALEVGKSPTEVPPGRRLPVAPPSAIIEFTSSSSCTFFTL